MFPIEPVRGSRFLGYNAESDYYADMPSRKTLALPRRYSFLKVWRNSLDRAKPPGVDDETRYRIDERQLAFVYPVTASVLLSTLPDLTASEIGYNAFDLRDLANFLNEHAPEATVYFGREGSPVLYAPTSELPRPVADALNEELRPDEFNVYTIHGEDYYRFWWD